MITKRVAKYKFYSIFLGGFFGEYSQKVYGNKNNIDKLKYAKGGQ